MKKFILFSFLSILFLSFANQTYAQGKVVWTQVVQLSSVEANTDSESMGLAIFRLTSDMKLHYKLIVQKLDDGDMLTAAHIHFGAAGVNGGVAIGLASSAADFGKNKTIQLTQSQYNTLMNDALYVNIHTVWYPQGSIRGQIR
jgi:hypothetical protein